MKPSSRADTSAAPKGVYSNYFEVGHTAFEFVLDFGQRYGSDPGPCHTRIVTSPIYAQALLETLRDALAQYTETFGSIQEPAAERPDPPRR